MYIGIALLGLALVTIFVSLVPAPAKADLGPEERVSKYTER